MGSSRFICIFIAFLIHVWTSPGLSAASRVNVAPNGVAVQSTTYTNGAAGHSNDGTNETHYDSMSCSATAPGFPKPWWRLELPGVYRVAEVVVFKNEQLTHLVDKAEILIGNSPENHGNNNPRCAVVNNLPSTLTQTYDCRGMEGRFVNLHQSCSTTGDIMSMCEVKVYGDLVPAPPSVSHLEIGRNVTLVGKQLCWSDALLYCRDFYWDLLSIMDPEDQEMVDELVASAPFPLTNHLWVGLRRPNVAAPWSWMSGDSVDFTQWDPFHVDLDICGGVSSMRPSLWGQHHCGEPLHFICVSGPTAGVDKLPFFSSVRMAQTTCVN